MGLRVYEPPSLREFAGALPAGVDLFVLASYGKILPAALLAVPERGALNVHPSLLPRYRGATPLQSALRDGARESGVTIMLMDAGMDTGDIVLQEHTPIGEAETYGELHDRLAGLGARMLGRALDAAAAGPLHTRPQSGSPSVTRPFTKDDLHIDWNWDAERIVNAVRAFSPQPGARAELQGTPVKLLRAALAVESVRRPPGTLLGISGGAAAIAAGRGAVDIFSLVPPNRAAMSGAAFAAAFMTPTA